MTHISNTKIEVLCRKVMDVPAIFWDDPNGPFTYICPYCEEKTFGSNCSMHTINHTDDCAFVIAEEILNFLDNNKKENNKEK